MVAENVVTDRQTDIRPSTVTLAAHARRGLMTGDSLLNYNLEKPLELALGDGNDLHATDVELIPPWCLDCVLLFQIPPRAAFIFRWR